MTTIGQRIKERRKELKMSQAELAKKTGISQPSISELEVGKTKATTLIGTLANVLKVSALWLETGRGLKEQPPLDKNVEPANLSSGFVPLISWVQAGDWRAALDDRSVYEHVPCPVKHSGETFALIVRGVSMYNPNGKVSFSDGDIIHVDPNRIAKNGDYVIAMHDGSYESTFKKLVVEDGKKFLMALNPSWEPNIQEIKEDSYICGVVICKQTIHKFY